MPVFPANQHRYDPYKNYKFRLKWDGHYVAGVSKMSALKRTTEVVKHREGGDANATRRSPGRREVEATTLEPGNRQDPDFEARSGQRWGQETKPLEGSEMSLVDFRKDIVIELFNEAGQRVMAYNVFRCWVSEYQALPELDANANAVAIQTRKLENEGWARDALVVEEPEPALT